MNLTLTNMSRGAKLSKDDSVLKSGNMSIVGGDPQNAIKAIHLGLQENLRSFHKKTIKLGGIVGGELSAKEIALCLKDGQAVLASERTQATSFGKTSFSPNM